LLNLTKSERRALLFVAAVLLISIIIQWQKPHLTDTKIYDYSMQDSLFRALSADTLKPIITETPLKKAAAKWQRKRTAVSQIKILKKVNINKAGTAELIALPGIGPAMAQRILEYRRLNGPFHKAEDLLNVKGIGPKKLKKLSSYVRFKIKTGGKLTGSAN